jgi:ribosome recycling factor
MSEMSEFREIVIKRLEAMPDNIRVSMGSLGTFSREDLIKNVTENTELGKFIIQMQINYMRSMTKGFVNE